MINALEVHNFHRRKIDFLLPESCKIVKNLGKRKILPPISPKESTLIIQSPGIFSRSINRLHPQSDDLFKEKQIRVLQMLFERSIRRFGSTKRGVNRNSKTPIPVLASDKKMPLNKLSLCKDDNDCKFNKVINVNAKSFLIKKKLQKNFCVYNRVSNSPMRKDVSVITE